MSHPLLARSPRPGLMPRTAGAALIVLLSACGGNDDDAPAPAGNGSLSAQDIGTAQAGVETPIVTLNAGTAALTATQIDSQRAALDGSTTDGAATIAANQTAMDTAAALTPAF